MAQTFPPGTKALVIGEDGLRLPLEREGFEIVSVENAPQAQVVVMGMDRGVNFEKLSEATLLVRKGFHSTRRIWTRHFPPRVGKSRGGHGFLLLPLPQNVEPIVQASLFRS